MTANTMLSARLPEVDQSVSIETLLGVAAQATDILSQIRDAMLEPYPRKHAPMFTSAQVAALCGLDKQRFQYRTTKGDLPAGKSRGSGRSKEFTLEEAIAWVSETSTRAKRPTGARARVLTVANFKGGVAKTTTAVSVAQALTLLGRKVLVIDCDPQGTTTQLCGWAPDAEITDEQTLLPLIYGDQPDLSYAVQSTYWHNLDLIPASSSLFDAEFEIPAKVLKDSTFEFWEIMNRGLHPLTAHYDVVIVDTPPALSYLTINALLASDAILLPCPPEGLDFASSTQFWHLFSDIAKKLPGVLQTKRYDFVNVVLTKSKNDDVSRVVKGWLQKAYGDRVLPMEIPESSVPKGASAQLSTVYDLSRPDGSAAAYHRYKEPLDRLAEHLDAQFISAWTRVEA
ncbi:AAA family ATPase [Burkholderia sp. 4M9327F10]|uniref:ParA family protein n=1 Tax=Burkholderia sp. 4M9327F10 TaxID=2502223 RepID=UPI00201725EB|nr:AAA family ATPase [Burkholderia sp. 4M9327F10]